MAPPHPVEGELERLLAGENTKSPAGFSVQDQTEKKGVPLLMQEWKGQEPNPPDVCLSGKQSAVLLDLTDAASSCRLPSVALRP